MKWLVLSAWIWGVSILAVVASPQPAVGELSFTGISVDGHYVYRHGEYTRRLIVLDGALAIAQLDFFPPDNDLACVWLESRLETLRAPATYGDARIEYCGGVGWQHLALEPRAPGWGRWTVAIGRLGHDAPDDRREFLVRRPDG